MNNCPHGYSWQCPHGHPDLCLNGLTACVATWSVQNCVGCGSDGTTPHTCAGVAADDKKRTYGDKPTIEERVAAERKVLEEARRGTINQKGHADGCECPRCKPGEWQ